MQAVDTDTVVSVFGVAGVWTPGRYAVLLRGIAEAKAQALWVANSSAAVFAPYDGGADLLYPSEWQRDAARDRLVEWLWPRAERPMTSHHISCTA